MSLEDDMYEQRIQRIAEIEALGFQPYGHRFDFTHTIPQILAEYGSKTAEELADPHVQVRVAGRIMTVRRMGKAGFAHLMQNGEQLQVYVRKDAVSEKEFALYQLLDLGDIDRRRRLPVPHPDQRAQRSRRALVFLSQRLCSPCPKSGMAWKTSRRAIASVISI